MPRFVTIQAQIMKAASEHAECCMRVWNSAFDSLLADSLNGTSSGKVRGDIIENFILKIIGLDDLY
jgi:hypothetical protein